MTSRLVLVGPLILLVAVMCTAQQVKVKYVPVKNVSPVSGEEMYVAYCAACHGMDGKGAGPAAPAMKTQPTDLTTLARVHGGQFPKAQVCNSITGDTALPSAHGSKDMPVWGQLFSSLCLGISNPAAKMEADLRVASLSDYVESLQQK